MKLGARTNLKLLTSLIGLAVGLSCFTLPAAAQNAASRVPRTADGKSGSQRRLAAAMNTANWDLRAHSPQAGPVVSLGAEFAEPRRHRCR